MIGQQIRPFYVFLHYERGEGVQVRNMFFFLFCFCRSFESKVLKSKNDFFLFH